MRATTAGGQLGSGYDAEVFFGAFTGRGEVVDGVADEEEFDGGDLEG